MDAVPVPLAVAGGVGAAAYLNAKYHILHDLTAGGLSSVSLGSLYYIWNQLRKKRLLTFQVLQDQALKHRPDQLFLIFEGRQWTYSEFYRDVVKVGNWLLKELQVKRGEAVALNGPNSAEYLMLWFAIDGLGAVTAFINYNLTGEGLLHCIKISSARYMIYDADVSSAVDPVKEDLKKSGFTPIAYTPSFIASLNDFTPLPEERQFSMRPEEPRGLIYTSGTTGLPKAVCLNTGRELMVGRTTSQLLRLKPSDRFYTCMPLYHGAAHGLCVTPSIHAGCTIVLGRKFSHKTFWPEVRASNANIIQYVGELCRYLLNAPPSPLDKVHNVKMAWGNGMRPDVWEEFRNRFGIPVIHELYAATDGAGATFNENHGDFTKFCIGKRGVIWKLTKGKNEVIVKADPDTGEVIRDKNGFAIRCGIDEPGQVVHRLDPKNPGALVSAYFGNEGATTKRRIRDVFEKGDLWFCSGDMMRQDKEGRVYFVDRLGDTFRWHSENVSTNEVSDVLGRFHQIAEANVYGVQVPRADGRCGCAAIVMIDGITEDNFDFEGLAKHAIDSLPRYAVPIFLRVTPALEYTGTLKLQKVKARSEGIDPEKVAPSGDHLYWLPPHGTKYIPFGEADYAELTAGRVRL
ncbi:long-chain fatty acid transporter-like protein [Rhizodiscina lignyota]|uniref:Very long-chain fatty acid transport protein n=1 Tax=Rhizodiscina lignyota TaxID=1504668 RepID=A0A9P4ICU1_9PEZI|nr:long-chain fatty acid transporter-like protein [Rhizodiscina lignyota]